MPPETNSPVAGHISALNLAAVSSPRAFAAFERDATTNARALLDAQYGIVPDDVLEPFLNGLAERLARPERIPEELEPYYEKIREIPFRIHILNSKDPVACVLCDGSIFVSYGYLSLCESVDELAGGIGHEMNHCANGHFFRGSGERFDEKESDLVSMMLLVDAAGFNSTHFIKTFRKLKEAAAEEGRTDWSFAHGSSSDRIADLITALFIHDVKNSFLPATPVSAECTEAIAEGSAHAEAGHDFDMDDLQRTLASLSPDPTSWARLSIVAQGVLKALAQEETRRRRKERQPELDPDEDDFASWGWTSALTKKDRPWDKPRCELLMSGLEQFFTDHEVRKEAAALLAVMVLVDCDCIGHGHEPVPKEVLEWLPVLCGDYDAAAYAQVVEEAAREAQRLGISLFRTRDIQSEYDVSNFVGDLGRYILAKEASSPDALSAGEEINTFLEGSRTLCSALCSLTAACGMASADRYMSSRLAGEALLEAFITPVVEAHENMREGGDPQCVVENMERGVQALRMCINAVEGSESLEEGLRFSLILVDVLGQDLRYASESPLWINPWNYQRHRRMRMYRSNDGEELFGYETKKRSNETIIEGFTRFHGEIIAEMQRAARGVECLLEREGFRPDEQKMIAAVLSADPEEEELRGSAIFAELRADGDISFPEVRTGKLTDLFSKISEDVPISVDVGFESKFSRVLARSGRIEELGDLIAFFRLMDEMSSHPEWKPTIPWAVRHALVVLGEGGIPLDQKLSLVENLMRFAGEPVRLDERELIPFVEEICALPDVGDRIDALTRVVRSTIVKGVVSESQYPRETARALRECIEHARGPADIFVLSHFLPRTGWAEVFRRDALENLLSGHAFEEAYRLGTEDFPAIAHARTSEWITWMDQNACRSGSDFSRLRRLVGDDIEKRREDLSVGLYLEDLGYLFDEETVEEQLVAALMTSRDESLMVRLQADPWMDQLENWHYPQDPKPVIPLSERMERIYELSDADRLVLLRLALLNPKSGIFHDKKAAERVMGKFIDAFIDDGVLAKKTARTVASAFVDNIDPEQLFVYFAPAFLDVFLKRPMKPSDHTPLVEKAVKEHLSKLRRDTHEYRHLKKMYAPSDREVTVEHITPLSGYGRTTYRQEFLAPDLNTIAGFESRSGTAAKTMRAIDALKRAVDWGGTGPKRLLQFAAMSSLVPPATRAFLMREGVYHNMSEGRLRLEAWNMIKREMPSFFERYQLGLQMGSGSTYTAYEVLDPEGKATDMVIRILNPNALYKSVTFMDDVRKVLPSLKRKMNPMIRAIARTCEGLLPVLEQSIVEDIMWYGAKDSEERLRAHDAFTHAGGRICIPEIVSMSGEEKPRFVILEEKAKGTVLSEVLGRDAKNPRLKIVGSLLARSLKEQIALGLVHADFHAGNQLVSFEDLLECWLIDRNRPAEVPESLRDVLSLDGLRGRKAMRERLGRIASELIGSAKADEKSAAALRTKAARIIAGGRGVEALFEVLSEMAAQGLHPSLDMFLLLKSMHYTESLAQMSGFAGLQEALRWGE